MKRLHKIFIILALASLLVLTMAVSVSAEDGWCECDECIDFTTYVSGGELHARCVECGGDLPYSVSIGAAAGAHFCNFYEVLINDNGWTDAGMPEYIIVFKGMAAKDKPSADYPETAGEYYVCLMTQNEYDEGYASTTGHYTTRIKLNFGHDWSYSSEGCSLHAKCARCGEEASVTVDLEGVYDANRNPSADMTFSPVLEVNWSKQYDILPYTAFYTGLECVDSNNTTKYVKSSLKPTKSGNYSVYLALTGYDSAGVLVELYTTKAKNFYVASMLLEEHMRNEYTDTQKSRFPEPKQIDGVYQVGTADELLWCYMHYSDFDYMNISLTDDIVVNPITITDDGTIYIGSNCLYYWYGFGSITHPFNGTIEGNGYTIYGIYRPVVPSEYASASFWYSTAAVSGFIAFGGDVTINNLTIENGYFNNRWAAPFVAVAYGNVTLNNCHSMYNYVIGTTSGGGFISSVAPKSSDNEIIIKDCDSSSTVCRGFYDGGFIGFCDPYVRATKITLENCVNFGDILDSYNVAGGLIGSHELQPTAQVKMTKCINVGKVSAVSIAGGLIGEYIYGDDAKSRKVVINDCTSTGTLSSAKCGGMVGGINGNVSDALNTVDCKTCYYFGTDKYFGDRDGGTSISIEILKPYFKGTEYKPYYNVENPPALTTSLIILARQNYAVYIDPSTGATKVTTGAVWLTKYQSGSLPFFEGLIASSDYIYVFNNCVPKILSNASVNSGFLCSHYHHVAALHYSDVVEPGCETTGSSQLHCRLCGAVLATKSTPAHGHSYEWMQNGYCCKYCGEKDPTVTASIFAFGGDSIIPVAVAAVLVIGGVAYVIIKRKKNKTSDKA